MIRFMHKCSSAPLHAIIWLEINRKECSRRLIILLLLFVCVSYSPMNSPKISIHGHMDRLNLGPGISRAPSPKRSSLELGETQEPTVSDKRPRYHGTFSRSQSPLAIPSGGYSTFSRPSSPSSHLFPTDRTKDYSTGAVILTAFQLSDQTHEAKHATSFEVPRIEVSNPYTHVDENSFRNLQLDTVDTPMSCNEGIDGDTVINPKRDFGPEICFGMIQNSTITTTRAEFVRGLYNPSKSGGQKGRPKGHTVIEASINCLNSFSTVHLSNDTKEYIGLLDGVSARGIFQILEVPSVRIQAFFPPPQLCPERSTEGTCTPRATDKDPQPPVFININVYGPSELGDDVGKILSENGIYLQHPKNNDKRLKYKNPHYFDEKEDIIMSQTTNSLPRLRNIEEEVKTIFDISVNDKIPEINMGVGLQTSLLSHQKQAVYFMLRKESPDPFGTEDSFASSIWKSIENGPGTFSYLNLITKEATYKVPQTVFGGILADGMGLGKSLTTLALITSSLDKAREFSWSTNNPQCPTSGQVQRNAKTTLIVAPASLLASWGEQIITHIKPGVLSFYIYHGAGKNISIEKLVGFDLVLSTYSTIRAELFPRQVRRSPLKEIRWFRIVLDEAHIIREYSTQQSKAVCMLEAQRRWCLTGTPIQNKLQDFGTLLRFLRLSPFDKEGTFAKYIVRPLKAANPDGLKSLRTLIGSTCLRRNKEILELPPRVDQEEVIHLEHADRDLYEKCKKDSATLIEYALKETTNGSRYFSILQSILRLRLMCNHGTDLLPMTVQNRLGGSHITQRPACLSSDMEDCVMAESSSPQDEISVPRCDLCNKPTDPAEAEATSSLQACSHTVCDSCLKLYELNVSQLAPAQATCPKCAEIAGFSLDMAEENNPQWMEGIHYMGPSAKVKTLIKNLRNAANDNGDEPIKSVVFSCWTKMLDLIGVALSSERMIFCRYDGSLNIRQRDEIIHRFRTDPEINILLISVGSGSVGLNLTVASRVHLMEPQWNPMVEHQALDRLHRIGQKNEVITTRYIVKNSIEESILSFQKRKLAIASISMSQTQVPISSNQYLKELQSLLR